MLHYNDIKKKRRYWHALYYKNKSYKLNKPIKFYGEWNTLFHTSGVIWGRRASRTLRLNPVVRFIWVKLLRSTTYSCFPMWNRHLSSLACMLNTRSCRRNSSVRPTYSWDHISTYNKIAKCGSSAQTEILYIQLGVPYLELWQDHFSISSMVREIYS